MAIKCIIVDDEPLAIEIVESYVSRIDQLQLQGTFRNAVQAFAYLQQHSVDLIFLDIQMPKLSGIEFLKTLKNPPKVIFTTAFRDYAIDGFDLRRRESGEWHRAILRLDARSRRSQAAWSPKVVAAHPSSP